MIIIKTQNGVIIECDAIIPPFSSKTINGARKSVTETGVLGTYESKERAKEVMEEIEEHIRQTYVAREFKVSIKDFDSLEHKNAYVLNLKESAVYTMPKE